MPLNNQFNIKPNDNLAFKHSSIRKKWIQNLIDFLNICLLNDDLVRAKRAWSILIRCREVNWKSRWYWGLLLLSSNTSSNEVFDSTQRSTFISEINGKDVERWLNGLRVSAREEDKPSLLHALVLHLIKSGQYRHAYDQLETYISSYPYLLSGPLHTYAGLLAFYLAQPISLRAETNLGTQQVIETGDRSSVSTSPPPTTSQPPDSAGIRQARGWFVKALEIDKNDEVARNFISLIDNPYEKVDSESDEDDEKSDDSMKELSDEDRELCDSQDEDDEDEKGEEDSQKDESEDEKESSERSWYG